MERAKERFRLLGAEIELAYFVSSRGEVIGIAEAEPEAMGTILFAMNANGHIEEEAVPIASLEKMDKVIERNRSVRRPGQ